MQVIALFPLLFATLSQFIYSDKEASITPFHFIPDSDGLISQYLQVENLITTLISFNRSQLILYPFTSLHFNDSSSINLCEIFDLKVLHNFTVTCKYIPLSAYSSLVDHYNCSFLGPHNLRDFPVLFQLRRPIKSVKAFNFTSGDCVAGSAWKWNGFRPLASYSSHLPAIHFQTKYISLLSLALNVLHGPPRSRDKKLVVVHWRRGDQLYTRCTWTSIFKDRSINCKGPEDLFHFINQKILSSGFPFADVKVYVATNEREPSILETLQGYNMCTYSSLPEYVSRKLRSVDVYTLEILLMTIADVFVPIGRSNTNAFIRRLRSQRGSHSIRQQLLYFDGQLTVASS